MILNNVDQSNILEVFFDLYDVKCKLQEEYGWDEIKVNEIEKEYKLWFIMAGKSQSKIKPPSKEVDMFWHMHIIFTKQYEKDCQRFFGKFLHHVPEVKITDQNRIKEEKITQNVNSAEADCGTYCTSCTTAGIELSNRLHGNREPEVRCWAY